MARACSPPQLRLEVQCAAGALRVLWDESTGRESGGIGNTNTGLNPRALEVQTPACAGEEVKMLEFLSLPAQAGACTVKALPFGAG